MTLVKGGSNASSRFVNQSKEEYMKYKCVLYEYATVRDKKRERDNKNCEYQKKIRNEMRITG